MASENHSVSAPDFLWLLLIIRFPGFEKPGNRSAYSLIYIRLILPFYHPANITPEKQSSSIMSLMYC